MESLESDLDPKYFRALLNGLIKMHFFQDATMTQEYIKKQVFASSKMSPSGTCLTVACMSIDHRSYSQQICDDKCCFWEC